MSKGSKFQSKIRQEFAKGKSMYKIAKRYNLSVPEVKNLIEIGEKKEASVPVAVTSGLSNSLKRKLRLGEIEKGVGSLVVGDVRSGLENVPSPEKKKDISQKAVVKDLMMKVEIRKREVVGESYHLGETNANDFSQLAPIPDQVLEIVDSQDIQPVADESKQVEDEQIRTSFSDPSVQLKSIQQMFDEIKAENINLVSEKQRVEEQLEKSKQKIVELDDICAKVKKDNVALLADLQSLQLSLENIQNDKNGLQKEKSQLEQQLQEYVKYVGSIEKEQQALRQEKSTLSQQLVELERKLSLLQQENIRLVSIRDNFFDSLSATQLKIDSLMQSNVALELTNKKIGCVNEELAQRNCELKKVLTDVLKKTDVLLQQKEKENESLLQQLNATLIKLAEFKLDNIPSDSERMSLFGAGNRVKQSLAYMIGQDLIHNSHSLVGWLKMVFSPLGSYMRYRQTEEYKNRENLPSLMEYQDYSLAEHNKRHLSYQLGEVYLKSVKNPLLWVLLPVILANTVRKFKKNK